MKKTLLAIALTASSALVLTGCSAPSFTASGTMTVPLNWPVTKDGKSVSLTSSGKDFKTIELQDGGICSASSGYDDISSGSQVTITNESGEVIALGSLQDGVQSGSAGWNYHEWISFGKDVAMCSFAFEIPEVPGGEKFYNVSIGNSNRGEITYSEDDLKAGIGLKLGE